MSEVDAPDKPRRRSRLAIAVVVIVLLGAGVGIVHRPLIEWWIRREALKRGVQLDFAGLSITPGHIVLRQTQVLLVGVPGLQAGFVELAIDLQGVEPTQIVASDAVVDVTDPIEQVYVALESFAVKHADTLHLPVRAQGDVRFGVPSSPWMSLSGTADAAGDGDVRFDGTLKVAQTNLGKLKLHRAKEGMVDAEFALPVTDKPLLKLSVDVGKHPKDKPLLKLSVDVGKRPLEAKVSVASVKVEDVCRAFNVPLPTGFAGAFVEGNLSLFVADKPADMHRGSASFLVSGWVPPHPRELDGIVYGRDTKLGATFEVPSDLGEMRITKASVEAGALRLAGGGNVVRDGLSARIKLDLSGNVACSELGASAIGSYVSGFMGDVLRGVARMGVGGTVKTRVLVDVDTKALDKAKVDQAVDIGCRLR